MKQALITISLVAAAVCIAVSFGASHEGTRSAFVYNEKLFNAFSGTIELKEKLKNVEAESKRVLDSLMTLSLSEGNMPGILDEKARVETAMQELSERYTADIWRQINESVSAYGSEHGYDFIFGASGDGNLMYARTANDITDDVIRYINRKYEGNE